MLKLLPEMMESNFGSLVIAGYDPADPDELGFNVLYEVLSEMRKGSVFMFGASDALWQDGDCVDLLDDLRERGILEISSSPLLALLDLENEESEEFDDIEEDKGATIYLNEKRINISDDKLFETRGFVELLSEESFRGARIPDYLRQEYFYSFLRTSARAPYWIGYENQFNLKRDFEETLEKAVQRTLQPRKGAAQKPVLLEGQTCSGKSMALGQLAWSIFRNHEYPVLYIRNPEIRMDNPANFDALDRLLQVLEKMGARKILLIWDNSQAFDQRREALKLNIYLQNRGRKTVLVSSSYVENNSSKADSNVDREFNIIRTEINLTNREMAELKDKIIANSEIGASLFEEWAAQRDASHLLALLYNLLRPMVGESIMEGVEKETNAGMKRFMEHAAKLEKNDEKPMTEMGAALKAVGLTISDFSDDATNDNYDLSDKFRKFFTTIAFCSQFQIRLPLFTALRLLELKMDNKFIRILAALENVSCLKIISDDLEDDANRWISFRTPLEARLYLESLKFPLEDEIKCVATLIGNISGSRQFGQNDEIAAIEKLIRIIGPNSRDENIFRKYAPYYGQILEALTSLRKKRKVVDLRLINQEITWLREIYCLRSYINQDCPVPERISRLREASQLARQMIAQNNVKYGQARICEVSSLIVEHSLCELHLQSALDEEQTASIPASLNFREIFLKLKDVIADNPSDIYARNALLKLFLNGYYDRPGTDPLERTRYLGEILAIVDLVESWVGQAYDDDEYKSHCHNLKGKESTGAQDEYIKSLIQQGDGAGLYLKARAMLAEKGIDLNMDLADKNINDIRSILVYMDEYKDLTLNHAGAQYMKLRLTWLLYNRHPPFSGEEKQRTFMTQAQWREIAEICSAYEQRFLNSGDVPINAATIRYMHALASAQIRNYAKSHEIFQKLGQRSMSFYSNVRNKIWHILCDEKGKPLCFEGTLEAKYYKEEKSSGHIKIPAIDNYNGVYFFGPSLQTSKYAGHWSDLQIGVGYRGFEAFRKLEEE